MMNTVLAVHGQGPARLRRCDGVPIIAQRNVVFEEMQLAVLAAWGQGVERQFAGFSSALARWKRRVGRRRKQLLWKRVPGG